jgi:hypothetical protein
MNIPARQPVDQSLSGWIDAYGELKAAQKLMKAAGSKSTLMMRRDIERLRQSADMALKHLQTDFDVLRAQGPKARHGPHT